MTNQLQQGSKQMSRPSKHHNWCKHRTPFTKDHKVCKVGVDFHPFEKGAYTTKPSLMPCLGECAEAIARCPKFEAYTEEEKEAGEKAFRERLIRMGTIREAIVAQINKTSIRSGSLLCPCCKTGTVSYSQSSCNGHIHAKCSTPLCASWME
jgi:hypothetical protein